MTEELYADYGGGGTSRVDERLDGCDMQDKGCERQ